VRGANLIRALQQSRGSDPRRSATILSISPAAMRFVAPKAVKAVSEWPSRDFKREWAIRLSRSTCRLHGPSSDPVGEVTGFKLWQQRNRQVGIRTSAVPAA
jgi:hypothetical protein